MITSASGIRRSRSAATASASSSRAPLFDTITGSSTSQGGRCRASASATASMIPALPSMPSLTASTRTSANTVSICWATKAGVANSMPVTSRVFCAVSAVIAAMP